MAMDIQVIGTLLLVLSAVTLFGGLFAIAKQKQ